MTPPQPYEWVQSNIHNLNFKFVKENVYKDEEDVIESQLKTVYGTQQLHAFMLIKKGALNIKTYSAYPNYTENCVISALKNMTELKGIRRFVICMYDNF
jgi:hypothetical protein